MNGTEGSAPMKELVKRYVPISNAADRFGVSRPTFYLFMQNYDEGRKKEIPENIREFLDLISNDPQPEEVKIFLTIKGSSDDIDRPIKIKDVNEKKRDYEISVREMNSLNTMLKSMDNKRNEIEHQLIKIQKELVMVKELIAQNPDDSAEYRIREQVLNNKLAAMEEESKSIEYRRENTLKRLREKNIEIGSMELDAFGKGANRSDEWTEDGDLMTLCIGYNGRSMVFFQLLADDAIEPEFTVDLIMNTPVGDMIIGTYKPDAGKSFVLIDDVIQTLRVRYQVCCKYQDKTIISGNYPLQIK